MGERFNELPTPLSSFTALFITQTLESRLPDAGTTHKNVCNVIEYSSNKCLLHVGMFCKYTYLYHTLVNLIIK